jgi:hypothetical protein
MERSFIYLILAVLLVSVSSCVVADEAGNPYKYSGPKTFAYDISDFITKSAVYAMEKAVTDEEAFKNGFSTVCNLDYNIVNIRKAEAADSTWVVTDALPDDGGQRYYHHSFNPVRLHYTVTIKLLGDYEGSGKHVWNAIFTGDYDEADGYSAVFTTMYDGIGISWKPVTINAKGDTRYDVTRSGACGFEIFRDNESLDDVYYSFANS